MTHEQEGCSARGALLLQQVEELVAAVCVQCGGGLVGNDDARAANQGAGHRHPLLLSHGKFGDVAPGQTLFIEPQSRQQTPRFGGRFPFGRCALFAAAGKAAGQQNVVEHGQVGNQIEHLKDETDGVRPQAVPCRSGQRGEIGAGQVDLAMAGREHAAHEAEQGGLAAAARSTDEQTLSGGDVEPLDVEGERSVRAPAVLDVPEGEEGACVASVHV